MEETPNLLIKEKIKMENKTLLNETLESGMESLKTMKPGSEEYFPTVTVRQLMWALRMKPLKKERWETSFDHVPI